MTEMHYFRCCKVVDQFNSQHLGEAFIPNKKSNDVFFNTVAPTQHRLDDTSLFLQLHEAPNLSPNGFNNRDK